MKVITIHLIITCASALLIHGCANQVPLSGGLKDDTPPVILEMYPDSSNNLNFKDNKIHITFDENIKVKNLKKRLRTNPQIKDYSYLLKNKTISISINEKLKDDQTYVLNFSNTISDLKESNIIVNPTIVFSTGAYIDSLKVSGKVTDHLTNNPIPNVLIALYEKDSLFKDPLYINYSNEQGIFSLRFIKNGTYEIVAINDLNHNFKFDPLKESVAFLNKPLNLTSDQSLDFIMSSSDTSLIKLTKISKHFRLSEVHYTKGIKNLNYHQIDNHNSPITHISSSNGKKQAFYIPKPYDIPDSIKTILQFNDSLNRNYTDTITLRFKNQEKKPRAIINHIRTKENAINTTDATAYIIIFNEPIDTNISRNSIEIRSGKKIVPAHNIDYTWKGKDSLLIQIKNSINDSSSIFIADNTFTSIRGLSNKEYNQLTIRTDQKSFGRISGTIKTSIPNDYILQLINSSNEIIQSIHNPISYTFKNLSPGKYFLRVFIDNNQNQKIDGGNIFTRTQPEKIYFYKEPINLKANWVVENINFKI